MSNPRIIQLIPPKIDPSTILDEITCTRPMRDGCFNISKENFKSKTVIHCYGHGGSGWTTLFGSISKAKKLLPNETAREAIRILGAGCMGLTAAIELARAGYRVAGISAEELFDIPSWRAAGYLALVSLQTSPGEQSSLDEIGIQTFKTYEQIGKGAHPYIPPTAVRFIPVYSSHTTQVGIERLEKMGLVPPREAVILDFGNGVRHPNYFKYMTYFIDTVEMMKQLTAEVKRLGIPIDLQTVHSFEEFNEPMIFDCSGIGGRDLNADTKMIPVRGHLIALNEKAGTEHMNYMIYTTIVQNGETEYVYLFPKTQSISLINPEGTRCQGVLGGSFLKDTDRLTSEQLQELDALEFQRLLDRNSLFFHGIKYMEPQERISHENEL